MFNLEISKGGFPLWSRKLEEKIEEIRREMEQVAMNQGITHPEVYQLSLELDQLHNQWQKEYTKKKHETDYYLSSHTLHVKENTITLYQTHRGA